MSAFLSRSAGAITALAMLSASLATPVDSADGFTPPGIATDIMRACVPYARAAFAHYIAVNGPRTIRPDGTVGPATEAMARRALAGEVALLVTSRSRAEIESELRRWPRPGEPAYNYRQTRFIKCAWERRLAQLDAGRGRPGREKGRGFDKWSIIVCNRTGDTINVAAEYREPGSNRWVSRGWWIHPSGACQKDLETSNAVIYLFAQWGAKQWPGDSAHCVNPSSIYAFYDDELVNNQCPPGMSTRNFVVVNLDPKAQVFTYTFLPQP